MSTVKTLIDYINPHATSTPAGDPPEVPIRKVFGTGEKCPPISSTKALTGHTLGRRGAGGDLFAADAEQRLCLRERQHPELDLVFADLPILRQRNDHAELDTVMWNSFGFGGTNATLVFKRMDA